MGFSVFVEMINLRLRDRQVKPVNLREAYRDERKMELQPVAVSVKAKPKSKKRK
jgi:hypothetical protein